MPVLQHLRYAAIGLLLILPAAAADTVTIDQKNKKFEKDDVTIKQGDSITFANSDPFTHNVYSQTPGMEFDLRTQRPGQSSTVTFDKVGTAVVECAIHPAMKMKVTVEPK